MRLRWRKLAFQPALAWLASQRLWRRGRLMAAGQWPRRGLWRNGGVAGWRQY